MFLRRLVFSSALTAILPIGAIQILPSTAQADVGELSATCDRLSCGETCGDVNPTFSFVSTETRITKLLQTDATHARPQGGLMYFHAIEVGVDMEIITNIKAAREALFRSGLIWVPSYKLEFSSSDPYVEPPPAVDMSAPAGENLVLSNSAKYTTEIPYSYFPDPESGNLPDIGKLRCTVQPVFRKADKPRPPPQEYTP